MAAMPSTSILITGAGGGLGSHTAHLFAKRGWHVFAADIRPPEPSANITPLKLDVTSTASVEAAASSIETDSRDGLGAVVNFAGVLEVGPLVEIPEQRLQRILDINVLGTYRVNKAVFPLLRNGSGRVINISSETGWQRALMMNGPYAMSKHAIEAYSDALRRELMFVGVPVVVIQPGPFRTEMTGGIAKAFETALQPGSPFAALARTTGKLAAKESKHAHDPAELAEVIWTAATTPKPKLRYSVRPDLRRSVLHHLPVGLTDRLLRRFLV